VNSVERFLPRVCLDKNVQSTEKSSFSIYDLTYNMLSKSIHVVVRTIHIHIIYFMIHGQQTRRSFIFFFVCVPVFIIYENLQLKIFFLKTIPNGFNYYNSYTSYGQG